MNQDTIVAHYNMLKTVTGYLKDAGMGDVYILGVKDEVSKFRKVVEEYPDDTHEIWDAHTRMIGQVMAWLDEEEVKSIYKKMIKTAFYAFYDGYISDEGPVIKDKDLLTGNR